MRWPGSGGRGRHPRWLTSGWATQREQKEQIPVAAEPGYFARGCITIGYHLLVIPDLPLPYAACHPDQVYFKESHSQRAGRVRAIVPDLHGVSLGRPPDQLTNFGDPSITGRTERCGRHTFTPGMKRSRPRQMPGHEAGGMVRPAPAVAAHHQAAARSPVTPSNQAEYFSRRAPSALTSRLAVSLV